jgi:hypothetical protein
MNQIDVKVFSLITAGTLLAIQILKKALPKLIENREEVVALVLPVLFTVIAKLAHAFHATPWVDALLWSVGGGVGSGLAHDYVMNPAINALKGLLGLGKKDDAPASDAPKQ